MDILSTSAEQASQRNMHIGCLLGSKNAYFKMNVKIERKSQCNCFSYGTQRLKRGALVNTQGSERVVIKCHYNTFGKTFSNSTQVADMIEVRPTYLG